MDEADVSTAPAIPDAHGQAAMLLIESVIHGLIATGVITVATAIEIVDVAVSVQLNSLDELGDPSGVTGQTISLLQAVSASLGHDLPN